MAEPRKLTVYIDYKSPYAYLAKDLVYELERDCAVRVDWLPYDLDLAGFPEQPVSRFKFADRFVRCHRRGNADKGQVVMNGFMVNFAADFGMRQQRGKLRAEN